MLELRANGQKLLLVYDEVIASGFVNTKYVKFTFDEAWSGMVRTAQFTQYSKEGGKKTYSCHIDDESGLAIIPNELKAGNVKISAFGVVPDTGERLTTIDLVKVVLPSGYTEDGETPIPPTPDLYAQLLEEFTKATNNGGNSGGGGAVIDTVAWDDVEDKPETFPPTEHSERHAAGGSDPITPAMIGAAPAKHTHTAQDVGALPNTYTPPVTSVNGMTGDVIIETGGGGAVIDTVAWDDVEDKPETFPPTEHSERHAAGGSDPITPAMIGAAPAKHTHTAQDVGAAPASHTHTAEAVGAAPVNHTHTAEAVGAAPASHTHTAEAVGAAPAIEDTNYPGCYYRMVDGEKEWINPPFIVGEEYRTTARYTGKPVYTKLLDCGASADTKSVQFNVTKSRMIDIKVVIGTFPANQRPAGDTAKGSDYYAEFYITSAGVTMYCGASKTGQQTYAQIWYVK